MPYHTIFAEEKHTILTPNRRLAAVLHKQYEQYQVEHQQQTWQTPDILPIASWIQRCWDDYVSKTFSVVPLLLNSMQEDFIWEDIIVNTPLSIPLLQTAKTATMVKKAWRLLNQWQVNIHDSSFQETEDARALYKWISQFQNMMHHENYLDQSRLPTLVTEKIKTNDIIPPAHISLLGFTELSPQLKYLLARCEEKGSRVSHIELSPHHGHCERIALDDTEVEIFMLARWAKAIWLKSPHCTIGCVIPSLDKIRDRVMQIFSEVFAEENTYMVDPQRRPFNISAGKSLSHYPIIHAALQLLTLYKRTIPIETVSYLCMSPFVGEAEIERVQRSLYDSLLRKHNSHHIDLKYTIKPSTNINSISLSRYCPLLAKRINAFLSLVEKINHTMNFSNWAECFTQLLTALGWPGERSLNSDEYQVVENWIKLLTEYKTLDQITGPVNLHQAWSILQKMTSETLFQPQTPETTIQVLGVLEAAAVPFDYLWITGMDDLSWPPQPNPHPFIPKRLQRQLNMPHATAERELSFCNALIQQFKHSAHQVIFSFAKKNETGALQVSPLIRIVAETTIQNLHLHIYKNPREFIYQHKEIEIISDNIAPCVSPEEKIRGGVNVIKYQAWCPFKAFAEWRLHAHEIENPLLGLRNKDRGTIIHKILELLWNKLQDQHTLSAIDNDHLHSIICSCIDLTLSNFSHERGASVQYLMLEKQRLLKLIKNWLQIEKNRSPFKIISSEKLTQLKLNHLTLSIKIDRIDELSNGQWLLIDYKTGKNNDIHHWFGDRPEEPQLPLYTLQDTDKIAGIAFAQLSSGEACFKGISHDDLSINGIKPLLEIRKKTSLSWNEQLRSWRQILEKLGDDFYHGVAKADPVNQQQTCHWCALKPLCRVNEEKNIFRE